MGGGGGIHFNPSMTKRVDALYGPIILEKLPASVHHMVVNALKGTINFKPLRQYLKFKPQRL